jgi:Flp pilus assembly protein TadG
MGQTLVLVVLGILVFVGILALVLDGGNAYAARRAAQNAADAGALAGAQYLCSHRTETGVIGAAISKAQEYANLNDPDVSAVDVTIDEPNVTVNVNATVTKDTFFAGLIGFDTVSPRAEAAAACMAPDVSTLPVAWSCRENVAGQVTCTENLGPCRPGDRYYTPGDSADGKKCTYLIMDSVKTKKGSCVEDPENPGYCQNDLICAGQTGTPPSCTPDFDLNDDGVNEENVIDCDLDNDCIDDLAAGGSRSWLDLDGAPAGGAADLKAWIRGEPVDPIEPHTWLAGESGVATSIFSTAVNYILGKDVILPVFNKNCNGYPVIDYVNPETLDYCNAGSGDHMELIDGVGPGTFTFHVISFSAFHVTCIQTGKNKADWEAGYQIPSTPPHKTCYGHDWAVAAGSIDENDKTIEGYFIRKILGGYGDPGDFYDTGTFTVGLIPTD